MLDDIIMEPAAPATVYNATLHRFTVDFLDAPITISIGKTIIDAIGKVMPELASEEDLRTRGMTLQGEEENYCIICLPEDADVNTIVHECMHTVNYLIHTFELPHKPNDDELMAYLMGFCVDGVFDAYDAHRRELDRIEEEKEPIKKSKKTKKTKA